ncbi:MAG: hypothetical protein LBJ16_01460 [Holosporaceae bacterium]|jgi:hypothetical protein|nr:hypothetical protein [Holosporaceae bacterium]
MLLYNKKEISMFFPWDFGIINAIKKGLEATAIFPSPPPEKLRKTPYLIFELKDIRQGANLRSRVEFGLTIVDENGDETSGKSVQVLRSITRIISRELTLYQEDSIIGSARVKVESIESRKNNLRLTLVAILQLKAIYEDIPND